MSLITIRLIATTIAVIELERRHSQLVRPQTLLNTYDYIVVGSGASGAVVAARLAEDYSKTVLLLEAGGPQNATSDVPALVSIVDNNEESEWNYPMVPQKYAYFGYTAGMVPVARAKNFGGCTVHNGMNYYRDSIEYWDIWNDTFGIKNWTFADVLPFFLKSENNLDKRLVRAEPEYHRSGGLYSVSTVNPNIMDRRYVDSAINHGAKWVHPDGRGGFGVTIMQRSIKDGIRQSTATAFLESDIKPNLQTIGFSVVTQVLFNENKRAIGVKFRRFNVWHTVYARNEVILSAGAIGSPQLLLLSGIGPKEHLNALGIPVLSDVSVGSYMSYTTVFRLRYDVINQTEIDKPVQTLDNIYNFYVHRSGPLAYMMTGLQTHPEVPFRTNAKVYNGYNLFGALLYSSNLTELVSGYKLKNQWQDYFRPYLGHTVFSMAVGITRIMSNGTIRLNSTNPFAYPLIDPCVYCNRQDLEDVIKTFQTTLPFYENSEIRKYIRPPRYPIPGCTPCADDYYCHSYIKCMAQTVTDFLYIVGTCRMGCDTDPHAVVDNRFRVRGVDRLRVIDTSVIPIDGTQETSWGVMLGERGAHFVKQDSKQ